MIATRHWLAALLLALVLHLAGFAVVMAQSGHDEGAQARGEQGIEVDLGMLGDLGAEAATQDVAAVESQPLPAPEPEPVVEPVVEPKTEPDLVAPKQQAQVRTEPKPNPKPRRKPEPESEAKPEPTPKPQRQPETAPASEPGDVDSKAQQSSRKATTGSGNAATSGGNPGAQRSYFTTLAAHLAKHKRYPSVSRRRGEEGIAKLFFELDRSGKVLQYRITASSGHERLDQAVLKMLQSAVPLPPFPPDMGQARLSVNIPIAFALSDRR